MNRTPPKVVIAKECVISMDNKSFQSLVNENHTSFQDKPSTNEHTKVVQENDNRKNHHHYNITKSPDRIPSVFVTDPPLARSSVSTSHHKKLSSTSPDLLDDGTNVSDYTTEDDSIEQLVNDDESDSDIEDAFAREEALEKGCLISATLPVIPEDNNSSSKKRKSYSDTESDDNLNANKKRPKNKRVVLFREDTMDDDIDDDTPDDIYEIGMNILEVEGVDSSDSERASTRSTDDSIDDILDNVTTETYTADVTLPRVFSLRRERYLNMEIDSSNESNGNKDKVAKVEASSKQKFSVYKGFTVYETVNMTSIVHGQKSPVKSPDVGVHLVYNEDNKKDGQEQEIIKDEYVENLKDTPKDTVDKGVIKSLSKTPNEPHLPIDKEVDELTEIELEALDFFEVPPSYESIYREPSPEIFFEKAVENLSDMEETSSIDWDTHSEDDIDHIKVDVIREAAEDGDDEADKTDNSIEWDKRNKSDNSIEWDKTQRELDKKVTLSKSNIHSHNSSVECIGEDRTVSVASLDQFKEDGGSEKSFSSSVQTSDSDGSAFSRDDEEDYEQPFAEIINETKMLTKSIMSAFATMTERENSITFSDLIDTTVSESDADCSVVSSADWDANTPTGRRTTTTTPLKSVSREQSIGSDYSRTEQISPLLPPRSSLSSRTASIGSTSSYGSYDTSHQETIYENIITENTHNQHISDKPTEISNTKSKPNWIVNTNVERFDKINDHKNKDYHVVDTKNIALSSPNLQSSYYTTTNEQQDSNEMRENVKVQSSSVQQINWPEIEVSETEHSQDVLTEKWSMKASSLPRLHHRLEVITEQSELQKKQRMLSSQTARPLSPSNIQKVRLVALPDHEYQEQQDNSQNNSRTKLDQVINDDVDLIKREGSVQLNSVAPMYEITTTTTKHISNSSRNEAIVWDGVDDAYNEANTMQIPQRIIQENKPKQIKIPQIFTQEKGPRVNEKYLVMSPTVKEAIYYEDYIASPPTTTLTNVFEKSVALPMEVATEVHVYEESQVNSIPSQVPSDPALSVHVNVVKFVKAKPNSIDTKIRVADDYNNQKSPIERIFTNLSYKVRESSSSDDDNNELKVTRKLKPSQYHSSENILLTSETTPAETEVAQETTTWEGESLPIKEASILHKPTSGDETSSSIESLLMHISPDADEIELTDIISDTEDMTEDEAPKVPPRRDIGNAPDAPPRWDKKEPPKVPPRRDKIKPPEVPPRKCLQSTTITTTTKTTKNLNVQTTNEQMINETISKSYHSQKHEIDTDKHEKLLDDLPTSPSPVNVKLEYHPIPVKAESTITHEPLQRSDIITQRKTDSPQIIEEKTRSMVMVEYEQNQIHEVVSPEPKETVYISNVSKDEDDTTAKVTTIPVEPAKKNEKEAMITNYRELLTLDITKTTDVKEEESGSSSDDPCSPDAFIRSPSSEAVSIPGYTSDEYLGSAETVIFQPSPVRESVQFETVLLIESRSSGSKESLSSQSTIEDDSQTEVYKEKIYDDKQDVDIISTSVCEISDENEFNEVPLVDNDPVVSEGVERYDSAVIESTLQYDMDSPETVNNVPSVPSSIEKPTFEVNETKVCEQVKIENISSSTQEPTNIEFTESAEQFEDKPYKLPDENIHDPQPLCSPTVVQTETIPYNERRLSSFESEAREQSIIELSETTEQFEIELTQPDEQTPQSPTESATAHQFVQVTESWKHEQGNFTPTVLSTAHEDKDHVENESAEEYKVESNECVTQDTSSYEMSIPALVTPVTLVERLSPVPNEELETVLYEVPSLSDLSKTAIMIPLIAKSDRKRTIASNKPRPIQLEEPQPLTIPEDDNVKHEVKPKTPPPVSPKRFKLKHTGSKIPQIVPIDQDKKVPPKVPPKPSKPITLSSKTTVNLKEAGVQVSSPAFEREDERVKKAEAVEVCEVTVLPDQLQQVHKDVDFNQIPDDVKELIPDVTNKVSDVQNNAVPKEAFIVKPKDKQNDEQYDKTIERIEKHVKKMGNVSIEKRSTQKDLCKTSMDTCASCTAEGEVISEEVTTKEMTLVFVWPKGCKPHKVNNDSIYRELFSRKVTRISDYNAKDKDGEHQKKRKAICDKDHGPEALLQ